MDSPRAQRFASRGPRVSIDPRALILRPDVVHIGTDVRIDAGVLLSGSFPIHIGDHVHLAAGVKLFSSGGEIVLHDFVGLSADVKIYTASDDYVGGSLTGPTVPDEFKDVTVGHVRVGEHVIIGSGSVVLPGASLAFGAAVGALSLVRKDVPEGVVVAGAPAREVGRRDVDRLRTLEKALRDHESGRFGTAQ